MVPFNTSLHPALTTCIYTGGCSERSWRGHISETKPTETGRLIWENTEQFSFKVWQISWASLGNKPGMSCDSNCRHGKWISHISDGMFAWHKKGGGKCQAITAKLFDSWKSKKCVKDPQNNSALTLLSISWSRKGLWQISRFC